MKPVHEKSALGGQSAKLESAESCTAGEEQQHCREQISTVLSASYTQQVHLIMSHVGGVITFDDDTRRHSSTVSHIDGVMCCRCHDLVLSCVKRLIVFVMSVQDFSL